MAEDFIVEIYENASIITDVKKMIEYGRGERVTAMLNIWKAQGEKISSFCKEVTLVCESLGVAIWDSFVNIRNQLLENHIFAATDSMEMLLTDLYKAVSLLGEIDVTEGRYRLYSSKSGFLNIYDSEKDYTYYSDIDPAYEKYVLAKSLYNPMMTEFCIMGCGLGYLSWQMYELSNCAADIYVYEADRTLLEYAQNFGVLYKIPQERLHIVFDEDVNRLMEKYTEHFDSYKECKSVLYIEEYFLKRLPAQARILMEKIRTLIQTEEEFGHIKEQNYYLNHVFVDRRICDIDWNDSDDEWIVVAGGPSLDDSIEYIKGQQGKKKIISASTTYGKLVSEGIKVDFVAVIDPQNRTYGHMLGVEDISAKLIMTDTANWQFGAGYKGDKYLVEIAGNYYSSKHGNDREWYSQGTVTAFCIDIAVYAGAKKIELAGVDLSYPKDHSHATGTMDDEKIDYSAMIKVKSVDGGEVYTDSILYSYISDLEDQVTRYSNVDFYNLSEHGALIKGCK